MDRKKELKEQYKQMRSDMGIMGIRSKLDAWCYIEGSQNLRAVLNGARFKLETNYHPSRELLKKWQELGVENFTFEVLEQLEYDKDETKTDYTDDLEILLLEWEEELVSQGITVVKR
ncbi:MAG: GIY-YIG nuclease family protein [Desulfitobacterium sp.]